MRANKGFTNRAKGGDKAAIARRRQEAMKARMERQRSRDERGAPRARRKS